MGPRSFISGNTLIGSFLQCSIVSSISDTQEVFGQLVDGRGGGGGEGDKSDDGEKAWSSTNHSILSEFDDLHVFEPSCTQLKSSIAD